MLLPQQLALSITWQVPETQAFTLQIPGASPPQVPQSPEHVHSFSPLPASQVPSPQNSGQAPQSAAQAEHDSLAAPSHLVFPQQVSVAPPEASQSGSVPWQEAVWQAPSHWVLHAVHWRDGVSWQKSVPPQAVQVPLEHAHEPALPAHSVWSSMEQAPPEQSLHPGQSV